MTPPATALRLVEQDEQPQTNRTAPKTGDQMTGAEALIHALAEQKVDTIFGYPGGAIMPIYDALMKVEDHGMTHILTAAEAGAGHAAQGYARTTGKPGVVFVTSGPGLTNAITPIADAHGDSIPMVVISGQVPSTLMGTDAFQEVDAIGTTRPITKFNALIKDPKDLLKTVREAFALASMGRPGPIHIDICKDVQNATVTWESPMGADKRARAKFGAAMDAGMEKAFEAAAWLMSNAKRPIFYVGGGVINSGAEASKALVDLMDQTNFPATSTLMGLGAYPTNHKAHLGMLGMHGTYEANHAMHDADLIIAVGARFDDRVTGRIMDPETGMRSFAPNARIIHIDIDGAEINKLIPADVPLRGDAGAILKMLQTYWRTQGAQTKTEDVKAWWNEINEWRNVRSLDFTPAEDYIRPQHAIAKLGEVLKGLDDYVVSTNVGQHQMWAAQMLPFSKPRQFLTSGQKGTMGYGLPAAIGGQWGRKDVPAFVVSGDFSWRMNEGEAEIAAAYDIPVKCILLNDGNMGMVKQWQDAFHGGRRSQSSQPLSKKDFIKIFEANGGEGMRITHPSQMNEAFTRMMAAKGPFLLEIMVKEEDCYPMVPAGKAHNDMILSREATARLPRASGPA